MREPMTARVGATTTWESGYTRVKAAKMASIHVPSNLSSDSECQDLWANIARAGMDMDNFSDDWNDVILDSATFLIEKGCVQSARRSQMN